MRSWMLVLIAATPLAAGCATWRRGPELPDHDLAVRGQLEIHSEFSLPKHHRLLDEVAALRDDVCAKLALPASDEPIHVYLFDSDKRYRKFIERNYPDFPARRAFFVETDTRLVIYAHWGDRVAEDLRHEAAHGYMHSVVSNVPLWLDEGLAEYFEVPRGRHGMNRPHVELLARSLADGTWQPDLDRLARLATVHEMTQADYAEAWLWVHFLLETTGPRRELLRTYFADLHGGGSAEPLKTRVGRIEPRPAAALVGHLERLAGKR